MSLRLSVGRFSVFREISRDIYLLDLRVSPARRTFRRILGKSAAKKFDKERQIRGKPSGTTLPKGRRRGWLVLIANTTFRRLCGGYGSHGAIIRPSYCGPGSVGARLHAPIVPLASTEPLQQQILPLSRHRRRSTRPPCPSFARGRGERGEGSCISTCTTYSGSTR